MNIMRKWWGSSGPGDMGGDGSLQRNAEQQEQHLALGLMHLKKLFSELLYPSHPLSEDEKEDKLYNMLPLFCKVAITSHQSIIGIFILLLNYCNFSKVASLCL